VCRRDYRVFRGGYRVFSRDYRVPAVVRGNCDLLKSVYRGSSCIYP